MRLLASGRKQDLCDAEPAETSSGFTSTATTATSDAPRYPGKFGLPPYSLSVDKELGSEVSYGSPPLVETSLGVGFGPIAGWNIQHFGLYHHRVKNRYPGFETANPIMLGAPGSFGFSIADPSPKIRAFYFNNGRSRLVQLQDDIFFLNWQKMISEAEYPRYRALSLAFEEEWKDFLAFLNESGLNAPIITRQQVTYINVIERTNEGLQVEDIFSNWKSTQGQISASHSDVSFSVGYRLGDVDLNSTLQPALRLPDNKPLYQFTLTSSVATITDSGESMKQTMDRLHGVLIAAFEEFASDRAKAFWGQL